MESLCFSRLAIKFSSSSSSSTIFSFTSSGWGVVLSSLAVTPEFSFDRVMSTLTSCVIYHYNIHMSLGVIETTYQNRKHGIRSKEATGARQMGHLVAGCTANNSAQALHTHKWRQGSTLVSLGSLMQTTHSLLPSTALSPVWSRPKMSCTK